MQDNKPKSGVNITNLDLTVNPKNDFYQYACGGWMKSNPLFPEFSSFGTFDKLRENARNQLRELIENLNKDPEAKVKDSITQKINDIYQMGMDEERLNKERATPILSQLEEIENLNEEGLLDYIAYLHKGLDSSFFSTGVGPDPADSNMNILHIGESGLSLGDRDYYLEKNETNDKILEAFQNYVKKIMALTGSHEDEQERIWQTVIGFETEMAKHKMSREDKRNPHLRHNPMSLEKIKKEFPAIDWERYFSVIGIKPMKDINISSPGYLKFINGYLEKPDMRKIKDYLKYSIVANSTGLMSDEFIDAEFELNKVMSGQEEKKPRWKRAMAIPNSMFGEAVGQLYVNKYFPEENKQYMKGLVENLRKALHQHIEKLPWMSEQTKAKAFEKLDAMKVKIGYPDKWKDYSGIQIDPTLSYLKNVQNASIWYTMDNYSKLEKPVDKEEWFMTPQTVNAYYSPVINEICFPAAILQPPYFNPEADDAMNYGAIGVVIGHEMTHGFDDQGRNFDKNGNLSEWWLPEDSDKFTKLAKVIEEQFDKVEVAPGVHANGKFTLGENIADQGGLRVALTAYLDNKNTDTIIEGFSPLQRFYLSYASVWASNIRDEEILLRTKSDPHSLNKNRVNVTLKNITPFMEAFEIEEGDPMFRKESERVVIW